MSLAGDLFSDKIDIRATNSRWRGSLLATQFGLVAAEPIRGLDALYLAHPHHFVPATRNVVVPMVNTPA